MSELIRLDEYCLSVRDGTHDTPKPTESGYYLVTSKAINNNTIDYSDCYFISEKDYKKINERSKVEKWDVIMTMIGTVGRLHLVQYIPEYAIKNIALFKIGNEDRAKWLYYYLSTATVQNYFELIASGTSQHFIGLGHLRKFKVENYRKESKQITDILSAYDNLIEVNNKRIKVLEQMAENLYKEWFVRFRFPGHETAEFENGIPKGWKCDSAEVFFKISIGKTPPRKEFEWFTENDLSGVNWASISDMKNSVIFETTEQLTQEAVKRFNVIVVPERTILLSFKLTIGRVAMTFFPCATNEAIAHFNNVDEICKEYLFLHLKNYDYSKLGNTSSIGNAVNSKIVKRMKIVLPKDGVLEVFHGNLKNIFEEIILLYQKNMNLIKQRDLLLPRLMSGKLEV